GLALESLRGGPPLHDLEVYERADVAAQVGEVGDVAPDAEQAHDGHDPDQNARLDWQDSPDEDLLPGPVVRESEKDAEYGSGCPDDERRLQEAEGRPAQSANEVQ